MNLSNINRSLLSDFESLIVDQGAFVNLSDAQLKAIKQAIRLTGLDLFLINVDEKISQHAIFKSHFKLLAGTQKDQVTQLNSPLLDKKVNASAGPLYIKNHPELSSFLNDAQGRIKFASRRYGMGHINIAAYSQTYLWPLKGQSTQHQTFWDRLLAQQRDQFQATHSWELHSNTIRVGEQAFVRLRDQLVPSFVLQQDSLQSQLSTNTSEGSSLSTFWPKQEGWFQLSAENALPSNFYAFDRNTLQTASRFKAWQQSAAQFKNYLGSKGQSTKSFAKQLRPINRLPFFLLFLIAAFRLWRRSGK